MTDKEKHDFIDHVVHLALVEEDRLLNEHGGDYSGLEKDGIDSNEYYRIITEKVITILKENSNYIQEEPEIDDLEDFALQYAGHHAPYDSCMQEVKDAVKAGSNWKEQQMIANAIDAEILENYDGKVIKYDDTILDEKLSNCKVFDKVKVVVIKEE